MKHKCLFLDRDGVINQDFGYVHKIEDFRFIDGICDLVYLANQNKFKVIVITNQAGIGRGYYTESDFKVLTSWMLQQFMKNKCRIDDVYYCPHHEKHGLGKYRLQCPCRKPAPGMILKAEHEHNIDLKNSILVGDKLTDIEAGSRAGVGTLLHFNQSANVVDEHRITKLSDIYKRWK